MAIDHPDRVRGLTPDEMTDDVRKLLNVTVERTAPSESGGGGPARDRPLHILTVMANHPTFLGPFIEWASAVALRGVLSRREQEILALRTAYNCRSEFEWGHHVVYGRAAGLSEADIDAVVAGPESGAWSPAERALLTAADQLSATACDIDDATFAVLRQHYRDAQLVEIPFVVGQYAMLSMFAKSLGVTLEEGYERLPQHGVRQTL